MHLSVSIVTKPIAFHSDKCGEFHNDNGAAIEWTDGTGTYAVHGHFVPKVVVDAPDTLDPDKIAIESNSKIKRIMIEKFGVDNYAKAVGPEAVRDFKEDSILGLH